MLISRTMTPSITRIIFLITYCAPFDCRFASTAAILSECEAAATSFEAALNFFKPFEDVVRNLEQSVSRSFSDQVQKMCTNPFQGATQIDPLAGSNTKNFTIRISNGSLELHPLDRKGSSVHDSTNGLFSLRRSLERYGKKMQDAHELSRNLKEVWLIMTESDQPLMLAQDVYTNSWPLPVISQCGRSSEKFDSNKLGHGFFTIPSGDVPIPDHSFQNYAYKGRGSEKSSWSGARSEVLRSYNTIPWSERTTALKYDASLGNGPFRSIFFSGLEKEMALWDQKKKTMPTKISFERSHQTRDSPHLPFDDICNSKYQLHIAGHSCAAGLKHKLACGSLVFLARNPFVEFWYGALKHFENVIFVEPDGSDLLEKLEDAVKNDKQSQKIAKNGSLLAEMILSDDSVDCYWILALERYISLFQRVLSLCEKTRAHASNSSTESNVTTLQLSQKGMDAEILYQRPADEPVFFEADGSQPSTVMSIQGAKHIQVKTCARNQPQDRNSTHPKGRVAFLFRGESFRNDHLQSSRSRCCKAGAVAQRALFESHEKMFNKIVADGYKGVDVFGTTYRCPSNVPSKYHALEKDLALWYSPWTREHGSMRILDPAYIPDSLVHQRAVFFDFWRGVLSWRGESRDSMDSINPYDFAIEFRWDYLVFDFSTCIFNLGNPLQMTDFRGTDADLMQVIPRRHMPCWRSMVQVDEAYHLNCLATGVKYQPVCSHNCAAHIRDSVDGNTAVWFNASVEHPDPTFHPTGSRMYIEPSCRTQAGQMFIGRKEYLGPLLGKMNIKPGCPECNTCGPKDKDPDGLTRRALGHTC